MRFRSAWLSTLVAILGTACAHAPQAGAAPGGPEDVAVRYAEHLRRGDLALAYGLSAGARWEDFQAAFASDGAARAMRAAEILQAAHGKPGASAALSLRATPEGWRVDESRLAQPPGPGPQEVARAFLDAAERGDFAAAWAMLSPRWRALYTPARLAADFAREPGAADRLARVRAAAAGTWTLGQGGASLALGDGRVFRLEREGDALKVGALE